jgi:hypothetical protein
MNFVTAFGSPVTLEISSAVPPFQLLIGEYSKLGPDGLPLDGHEEEINCLQSDKCKMTFVASHLDVSFSAAKSEFIVVRVAYLKPKNPSTDGSSNLSPDLLTASWVVERKSDG